MVSTENLPLITTLDVSIFLLKEDRIEAISPSRVNLPHFLITLKFYIPIMKKEKPVIKEKSGREMSEEVVLNLKKYFSIFLILVLLVGMFVGFIVLYS